MRVRTHSLEQSGQQNNMAAMIDVVFLLLIFFMLTLQIREPEGDFRMAMASVRGISISQAPVEQIPIRVRIHADERGELASIVLGQRDLGAGEPAFKRLQREMRVLANLGLNDEVTIDADYQLNYEVLMRAISTCRGERDVKTGRIIPFFEKVQLAQPRRPL